LIISPRGSFEPWALNQSALKKRLAWFAFQKRILQSAALLCVTSEQEGQSLRALGLRAPLAVIPNGIEMPHGQGPSFDKTPRTILFLSRVHPKKGLLNLVEAWRRIRPAGWNVVVAGPDERGHRAEVERAVASAGLEREIKFLGPVFGEAKHELYRTASLFVLPTHSENFGVVVVEALSHGVPVITTKAAPWGELETHRCGWWVDVGVAPLEQALKLATSASPDELREMGFRGKALARKYDWEAIAAKMVETYEWVLGTRSAPDFVHA
jgi:glycosyltransferase involved in cell wall biosynthesis